MTGKRTTQQYKKQPRKNSRKRTSRSKSRRKTRRIPRIFRRFPALLLVFLLLLGFAGYRFPKETRQAFLILDETLGTQIQPFLETAGETVESTFLLLTGKETDPNTNLPAGDGDFQIHFLDVGQGLSVLIRSGDHAMLYDGGDRDTSSFVVAYLKKQNITSLDYVIASHYDADHISGLIGVLKTVSVDSVLGPDYHQDSATADSFLAAVSDQGKSVTHPSPGDEYVLGNCYFTVVAPLKEYSDSNNNSVAIRIVNGENSFLLTGDAEAESEEDMCLSGENLYCDVLCLGHHGSSGATSSLFLSFTQPEYGVISVGADNEYGHPHSETLQRLSDAGVQILRTDESGTIIARSDGQTITWTTSSARQ